MLTRNDTFSAYIMLHNTELMIQTRFFSTLDVFLTAESFFQVCCACSIFFAYRYCVWRERESINNWKKSICSHTRFQSHPRPPLFTLFSVLSHLSHSRAWIWMNYLLDPWFYGFIPDINFYEWDLYKPNNKKNRQCYESLKLLLQVILNDFYVARKY